MEVELIEIRQFLALHPPFNLLTEEQLDGLVPQMEIRYLRRGKPFPPAEGYIYIVRSGAIELRDDEDEMCEKLGEGDLYTTPCQLLDFRSNCRGVAAEDTLLYLVTCSQLKELCRTSPPFNKHFSASLRDRLRQAVSTVQVGSSPNDMQSMTVEIKDLVRKEPVIVDAGTSIQETAQVMSEQNVSSVMVVDNGKLAGVITDRDLRRRCVAIGRSGQEPARSIMTANPQTIQQHNLMVQALMTMTRLHVHHLPVLDGERLVGMITATDLARHQSTNSAYIAVDIRKAKTVEDLVEASNRLPALQMQLAYASATALHIGEAISCITDSLTSRLLEMAEAELGPPPVPYVWMAGGSQARHEQSSHSDQDNALLISDDMQPEHEAYFERLAKFVSDGLNECGFVYCPGNAMATNPQWRQPLRVWRKYFTDWINKPEPMALMLSSIFFDLRPVRGDDSLFRQLQDYILGATRGNTIFLAYMAANALQHRPPLGFFRTFVLIHGGDHDDTFDIKHRGIVPITDLARVYALSEGLRPVNTTERLRAAVESGALSRDMGESLEDALELIASLRIRHQAELIRQGKPSDNYLPPEDLSSLEREHLKDSFRVIQTMQSTLESRYQAGRFR